MCHAIWRVCHVFFFKDIYEVFFCLFVPGWSWTEKEDYFLEASSCRPKWSECVWNQSVTVQAWKWVFSPFCFPEKSISFILFIIFYCFLFQNVRHDVVYYYKPAPSNSLQPFEKFTNLPADRQLLLRSRDDFEESRRIYQTIASTWKFQYDNIFGTNLAMDLIIEIDIYYIYFAVRKEMNSCNKQMQKYANLLLLLSW